MNKKNHQILLTAIFQSARTTIDGGWRISFDVHEEQGRLVSEIAKLKDKGLYVVVSVAKKNVDIDNNDYSVNMDDLDL